MSREFSSNEVILYDTPDGEAQVDVRFDRETAWLTLHEMAKLFGRHRSVLSRHVRNIFEERELAREATCANFAQVRLEGERKVERNIEHYNLDMILSVGYRVNSKQAVRFRQWATRVLRGHLLRGYTLHERRLAERGLNEARDALDLLARTLRNQALVDDTGATVLQIIVGYADTWRLLLEYDENRLAAPSTNPTVREGQSARDFAEKPLDHADALAAIAALKDDLAKRGEASALFGKLKQDDALAAILGNIEQTMFGEPLYPSPEHRAAHLLYFIVKDHPFIDGNKRIGSLLFLLYLARAGMIDRFNPQALTALTLLVAESRPDNKELMVRLIMNLMTKSAG